MPTTPGPDARQPHDANDGLLHAYASARSRLVSALTRMLGSPDDALDVAQTAFLKCWRTRARLQDVHDLQAWVFRVGLNAGRDLRRDVWRRRARPLSADAARALPAATDSAHREALERLTVALATLRPAEREVFLLRQHSDHTFEEIAVLCNVPVGTVKTRMRAALAKLREALSEDDFEPQRTQKAQRKKEEREKRN